MAKRKKSSSKKRKVKIIKKLARAIRVPPTKVHDKRRDKKIGARRRPKSIDELMDEEGW